MSNTARTIECDECGHLIDLGTFWIHNSKLLWRCHDCPPITTEYLLCKEEDHARQTDP